MVTQKTVYFIRAILSTGSENLNGFLERDPFPQMPVASSWGTPVFYGLKKRFSSDTPSMRVCQKF